MFFFFKQKTAYELRISDWSSDVCSSDLLTLQRRPEKSHGRERVRGQMLTLCAVVVGEEREALGIEALEQQDPAVRAPQGIHGRQSHGIGLHRRLFGFHRVGKPLVEQRERLGRGLDRKSTRLNSSH